MSAGSKRLQAQEDGGVYYDVRWMDVADRRSNFTGVYVASRHIRPNTGAALFIQSGGTVPAKTLKQYIISRDPICVSEVKEATVCPGKRVILKNN
jgi:hypothetical protein